MHKLFMVVVSLSLLLSLAACRKKRKVDIMRNIPPLETTEHIIYGLRTCKLERDSFKFQWHKSTTSATWPGTTSTLEDDVHVCESVKDVNERNAWVRRALPVTLKKVTKGLGISKKQRKILIEETTIAVYEIMTRKGIIKDILDSYEGDN